MSREEGIELCVRALWQAADEDSATGGPDAVRGIYPTVATITAAGFERVPEAEVAAGFGRVIATRRSSRRRGRPSGRPRRRPTAGRAGRAGAAMTMPFYVAPEQFMKDKADFARKNIGRGRPLVATVYADGRAHLRREPSRSLHKVSEIYDRIAFAGVGKYNEFDQLRVSGVQHADIKGYQFSREDVDARSLANLYARYMGNVFTHEMKPLEVEILVAEVGAEPGEDQMFHILYDGTVVDEDRFTRPRGRGRGHHRPPGPGLPADWSLAEALSASVGALPGASASCRRRELEVAVLDRANGRRAFRRVLEAEVAELLSGERRAAQGGQGHPRPRAGGGRPSPPTGAEVRRAGPEPLSARQRGYRPPPRSYRVSPPATAASVASRYWPMKCASTGAPATSDGGHGGGRAPPGDAQRRLPERPGVGDTRMSSSPVARTALAGPGSTGAPEKAASTSSARSSSAASSACSASTRTETAPKG